MPQTGPRLTSWRMITFLNALIVLALIAVVGTLALGIYTLVRSGGFSQGWSNRLMRLRVLFQAIAIGLLLAAFWASQNMAS